MTRTRDLLAGAILVALAAACADAGTQSAQMSMDMDGGDGMAPMFEVDPFWPKPLPNHWLLGATIGVAVDSRDHVYIVHRNTPDQFAARTEIGLAQDPPLSECCQPAPPVLEFDPEGNLVNAWGGPQEGADYEWPTSNHGMVVDHMDNVWIGGNGGPLRDEDDNVIQGADAHVVKFSRDGTFLMQVGSAGQSQGSLDMSNFSRVAKVTFDAADNEAYIADGYGNKRIVVIDMDTGEFKRYWGAYGNEPDDDYAFEPYSPDIPPAQQFRGPVHCADPSSDGLVYVCDRASDRIQVFQKDGTFVREVFIAPETLSQGSTWDVAFSPDPEQTYMYVADGQNMKVYVLLRETMEVLYSFGDGGRQPGLFFAVHSIATDSQGNIFTTETYEGKRVQKFVYTGMGEVTQMNMGPAWPGG